MFKKVISGAVLLAALAVGSSNVHAAPLSFSYDNVVVTETNVDSAGNTHIYHVGILTPNVPVVDGTGWLQTIDFNVGTAFTVGVPDPISGLTVVASDLSISYDVDPGNIGPITSIHSYAIHLSGPGTVVANETVTVNGVDYFIDPSVDSVVNFPANSAVHVLKDIELFGARNDAGKVIVSGTSIIRQGVDSHTSVPEPGSVAMLIGAGISGGFLVRRRRK